ncbi:hypothetical protein [Kitasatospora sp. NPDC057936]|uniref:hypothetical protein n=1 Tax=Kitasatospora sp. NPDC057936 TaxID=3346283 RepID=UPI0036DD8946
MARDYDSQLLESVAVRRRRMRDALLFGAQRVRRTADERFGKVFAGIAIAAVLCAGCVGWSFLQTTLAKQKADQQKQQQQQQQFQVPHDSPDPSRPPTPSVSPSAAHAVTPQSAPKAGPQSTQQVAPTKAAKSPEPAHS